MARTASEWSKRPNLQTMPFVDSRIYSDQAIFEEEIEKIWKKTWILTVHESELPNKLDYRSLTIAREPIVVVRGPDDKIRAFLNVCPHRGNIIVRRPAGTCDSPNARLMYQ